MGVPIDSRMDGWMSNPRVPSVGTEEGPSSTAAEVRFASEKRGDSAQYQTPQLTDQLINLALDTDNYIAVIDLRQGERCYHHRGARAV